MNLVKFRKVYDLSVSSAIKCSLISRLNVEPSPAGFFGSVFVTLNGIRFAEKNMLSAKVHWGKSSKYFEEAKGENAWSYFFERSVFNFASDQHSLGLALPYRPRADEFLAYEGLSVKQSVSCALHSWCKPRDETNLAVTSFTKKHFIGKKLGIHVRRTDVGNEGRKTIEVDSLLDAADLWLKENSNGTIFLATDDANIVRCFEARYPGLVCYQECLRSTDGASIHGHYDSGLEGSPFDKGREVLIDALLLAQCDHLIRTNSAVTAFSLCWNPTLSYQDLSRDLLGEVWAPWLHVSEV